MILRWNLIALPEYISAVRTLGKILIKNKKKQSVSEKRQNSMKKGKNVEPEIIEQPAFMDAEDTGMSEGGNGTSTAR